MKEEIRKAKVWEAAEIAVMPVLIDNYQINNVDIVRDIFIRLRELGFRLEMEKIN